MELVPLLDGDREIAKLYREEARILKKLGQVHFVNHGTAVRVDHTAEAQQRAASEEIKTELEKVAGWSLVRRLRDYFLNRGAAGQNVARYPIPYAFEGHISPMRVSVVNAEKKIQ